MPSTLFCEVAIGVDQQERKPNGAIIARKSSQSGSIVTSSTITVWPRHTAVPQEPTLGPIVTPSIRRL